MWKITILMACAMLAVAACGPQSEDPEPVDAVALETPMAASGAPEINDVNTPEGYLVAACYDDLYLVAAARAIKARFADPEMKALANSLEAQHVQLLATQSNLLADVGGTAAPTRLSARHAAYVADLDFYKDLVAFAKKHDIFILSDLAYAEVYFDEDKPPPSVLQVPGALDVTVEFTSMSKTFSMAGWRMGFAVGNERIIAALARVKSYLDYGAFTPVQVAATAALNGPDDCIREMRDTYRKRRDALVESFGRAGWDIPPPQASMFAWAPLPKAFEAVGSMQFATLMVEKSGVVVSPGVAFGEHGALDINFKTHALRSKRGNVTGTGLAGGKPIIGDAGHLLHDLQACSQRGHERRRCLRCRVAFLHLCCGVERRRHRIGSLGAQSIVRRTCAPRRCRAGPARAAP